MVPVVAVAGTEEFPLLSEGGGTNILTSKALEFLRIQRQLEADEQYGTLADPTQQPTIDRLAGVLAVMEAFGNLRPMIEQRSYARVVTILSEPPFDKKSFKRIFNAYTDNVYYSDPDRANVYLLGGAVPTTGQTMSYLYRNDALDHIDELRDDLIYLLDENAPSSSKEDDLRDALATHDKVTAAFQSYLNLVPPTDITDARRRLSSGNS